MKILSKRQILMLHAALAARAGSLDGLRDEGLLDSAIHAPMQTFARLGYGLIRNHPFADGNKRIGTHAMLVFLAINGVTLSYEDEELITLILRTAAGDLDEPGFLAWLKAHVE